MPKSIVTHAPSSLLHDFVGHFAEAKCHNGTWSVPCPAHGDEHPSLDVTTRPDGTIVFHCQAGCSNDAVWTALQATYGITSADVFPASSATATKQIVATYDYRSATGALLYQSVRYVPKEFRQRRPNGSGGWIWNMQGLKDQHVAYRLPDLMGHARVFVVEGEKDADRLWTLGLPATTNIGGAGKWGPGETQSLVAAGVTEVVVFPDHDAPGAKQVTRVQQRCRAADLAVRIVPLPGLPPKGDVSDWLDAGHTKDELLALVEAQPVAAAPHTAGAATAGDPATNVLLWPGHPTACNFCLSEGCTDLAHLDPHHTENGNAIRFVKEHRARVRYCYPLATWFWYDGRIWRPDTTGEVLRLAKATVAQMYADAATADEAQRKALAAWALKSESEQRLTALLKLARPEVPLLPEALDADPWALNVLNGTLDLRTRILRPHAATDLLTKLVPVAYDPEAHSALWTQALVRALPEATTRDYVQRLAGYTLAGVTGEDVFILVHGPTRTAKGTIQEALATMLGDYAVTSELDLLAEREHPHAPRPEVVRLRGARMVSIYETSRRLKLSASLVKTLAGSDPITARDLHTKPITFRPAATLWLATNYRPKVANDDDALWARVREVPFTVTIPEADRDPAVRAQLRDPTTHGAAILAWAVEGCRRWQAEGLGHPDAVKDATQAYRNEMDPLRGFLDERCLVQPECWARSVDLRAAYEQWARESGERPVDGALFQAGLRQHGFTADRRHAGRGWAGIGLLVPATDEPTDGDA